VEQDQKYIHAVPIEKLRSLAGSQLEVVWQQYDLDGNGVLDRKELALLASDCIARALVMVGEEVRKQNPNGCSAATHISRLHKNRLELCVIGLDCSVEPIVTLCGVAADGAAVCWERP